MMNNSREVNKKKREVVIKLAVIGGTVIAAAGFLLFSKGHKTTTVVENKTLLQLIRLQGGDVITFGCDNASVIMVEFTDLACPFSRLYFMDTFPLIYKEYIKTCKVKYIIKDAPIPQLHGMAPFYAAQLLRCIYVASHNLTLYWLDRNITYLTAREWATRNATYNSVTSYLLRRLYIPSDIYDEVLDCQLHNSTAEWVYRDYIEAFKVLRVPGTPAFLIIVPKDHLTEAEKLEIVDHFSKYYRNIDKAIMEEDGYYLIPMVGALPYNDFKYLLDRVVS